ncbi:uncharacterized protein LOC107271245 [Cephus cinctus]|uniref:Uncharacterized protein LOC107271245 n=1 Tax=Cephus cinctus TaxID=211228 RepID=A0AAJ7RNM3_CEPCN|nr:uncharacterized protein LOC107271245 [Cephus cinctus]XP_024944273.1 uncharacterized protein LOC107271245 [Cephus cinctus]
MRAEMHCTAAIVIGFFCLIMGNSLLAEEHSKPGQEFIQTLPECERPDFITFELGRGYTQSTTYSGRSYDDFEFPDALDIDNKLIQKFQSLDVPQNFTTNLYSMVQTKFSLDNEQIRTLILERSVCSNNYMCISIEDIGNLCCPF